MKLIGKRQNFEDDTIKPECIVFFRFYAPGCRIKTGMTDAK
jgi:hypothetical protein